MPRGLALLLVVLLTGCSIPPGAAPTPATATPVASTPSITAPTPGPAPSRGTPSGSAPATPTRTTSPSASTTTRPLAGRTIVVDPGHNGVWTKALNRQVPAGNGRTKACNSSGTAGGDFAEHAFTWATGQALADRLRTLGATVTLTRPNDRGSGPCVNVRAARTNAADADLLISLHADGNLAKGARGYHIIVSSTMIGGGAVERRSMALARNLRSHLDATSTMPRSTYIGDGTAIHARTDIAGLNLITVPGVMLELGNMRNATDLALQRSPAWRASVAKALAAGVVDSLD
ncbi:MAG: N-acetylmuramoyl-L-alanine amidase [Micropruina sp.]|nr:N-acetylmuramoyl-L-alanine amidase [Micropruina sp.]